MQTIKFRSPDETTIHVTSLTGHAARVGPDWRELPPMLHKAAIAAGCITDNMTAEAIAATPQPRDPAFNADAAIKAGIVQMLEADKPDENFTKAGLPNLNVLSHVVGFGVDREQMQKVWAQMQATVTEPAN